VQLGEAGVGEAEMLTSRLAKLGGVLTSGSRRLERADKPPIGGVPIW
jgi:hypothetical protein